MTALSIPERAREIALPLFNVYRQQGKGWRITFFGLIVGTCDTEKDAEYFRDVLMERITDYALKVAHSERELCAKELDKVAEFYREEEMLTLAQAFDAEAVNVRKGLPK